MRHFDSDSAESAPIGDVDVARWDQYGLGETLPFQAMWYTVPPRTSPPPDRHPELELSVVISGTASVETGNETSGRSGNGIESGGTVIEVAAGSSFLLDSGETHIIHNRSADTPLVVFSAYWMPPASDAVSDSGGGTAS